MPSFAGTLKMAGSRDAPLEAAIDVNNGRIRITGGSQEIGDWSLSEVELRRDGAGARLRIEDEVIIFKTEEIAELAEAVNPPEPEAAPKRRVRKARAAQPKKTREKKARRKKDRQERTRPEKEPRQSRRSKQQPPVDLNQRLGDGANSGAVKTMERPETPVDPYQPIEREVAARSEAPVEARAPVPEAKPAKPKAPKTDWKEKFASVQENLVSGGVPAGLTGKPAIAGGVVLLLLLVVFAPAVLGGLLLLAGGGLFLLAIVAWMDPIVEARLPSYAPLQRIVFIALVTMVAAVAIGAIA